MLYNTVITTIHAPPLIIKWQPLKLILMYPTLKRTRRKRSAPDGMQLTRNGMSRPTRTLHFSENGKRTPCLCPPPQHRQAIKIRGHHPAKPAHRAKTPLAAYSPIQQLKILLPTMATNHHGINACLCQNSFAPPIQLHQMKPLRYLAGYPATVIDQVHRLIDHDKLAAVLLNKYPVAHDIRTDKALYAYVMDMKNRLLRQSSPLSKVVYDDKIDILHQALGLHSFVSRVQGNKLKSKNEIRIASIFKNMPIEFLRMIVMHELAHLREKQHNKAFYNLCVHMEPGYHQLEFDTRLYLTHVDIAGKLY